MAVDTIRLRSPYISEVLAQRIESECTKRIGIDLKTDTLLYEITTGALEGSYDSRISIVVKRQEWVRRGIKGSRGKGSERPLLMPCKPYIEVEASVHKLFVGHNIYGGTDDFQGAAVYLLKKIEELLGVELPGSMKEDYEKKWIVLRIDFAYVFYLEKMEAVQQFFYLMKNSYYPRRNVDTYGLNGIVFNASTSVVKMYYKGDEFRKHDFARLRRRGTFTESDLFELLQLAGGMLRVEVELKSRKLKYDFDNLRRGNEPYITDITPEYLQRSYEIEVDRVMKEGRKKSDIVRDSLKVEERLYNLYSISKANSLYKAYMMMSQFGIERYKQKTPKRTYYRHLKELKEAGISVQLNDGLNVEDVTGIEYILPEDFQPLRDDPRRMAGVDEDIKTQLSKIALERKQKKDAVVDHDATDRLALA